VREAVEWCGTGITVREVTRLRRLARDPQDGRWAAQRGRSGRAAAGCERLGDGGAVPVKGGAGAGESVLVVDGRGQRAGMAGPGSAAVGWSSRTGSRSPSRRASRRWTRCSCWVTDVTIRCVSGSDPGIWWRPRRHRTGVSG
jgi:hypothetical protein